MELKLNIPDHKCVRCQGTAPPKVQTLQRFERPDDATRGRQHPIATDDQGGRWEAISVVLPAGWKRVDIGVLCPQCAALHDQFMKPTGA